jgi:PAS domain S-box-containing protein
MSDMEHTQPQLYVVGSADGAADAQNQEVLLKAGALQSAIFNSAYFSSIATDARGVIQIFNVGAERMLGYAAADVINKITQADISDPQEVIERAKALSLELDTTITPGFEALVFKAARGIEDIYELTYIRKDGSRFPAVVSVTALRDAQNVIIGYLLIGTDNTARKQAEEALLKAGALQNAIFNSANFSSIATDAKGVIQIFNVGAERMLGYTAADVVNKITPADISDPQEVIERAQTLSLELDTPILPGFEALVFKASRGIEDIYELTARARDGKETVVSYNATTFYDRDRNLQGVFAAARDVTERKLLDQALQENNIALKLAKSAAEKANLAKSEFLSSMSHELRTPLNAILGFAQLIESGDPVPTPLQRRSTDQILQAGWYLLELINEILDLALIESGKLMLAPEPVSLADVMSECETMVESQAKRRDIRVSFPALDWCYTVKGDRTRLKQVLINLLSNAIKYNRTGGTVVVSLAVIAPGRLRIGVSDTGDGLTSEKLEQLFQPFNRLGKEATTEEGTGIGLVVCKRLVELMGGTIGVESVVGQGSSFWIELALTAEPYVVSAGEPDTMALAPVPVPEPAPAGARIYTVLYVEDNQANQMLMEALIERRPDMRLMSARNGLTGIEVARTALPDVILMDINLPGISGTNALTLLAADPATAHIPVIAISANAMPRDIAKGLAAGFSRYLTKPIRVDQFMETLLEVLTLASDDAAPTKLLD